MSRLRSEEHESATLVIEGDLDVLGPYQMCGSDGVATLVAYRDLAVLWGRYPLDEIHVWHACVGDLRRPERGEGELEVFREGDRRHLVLSADNPFPHLEVWNDTAVVRRERRRPQRSLPVSRFYATYVSRVD